jgi:hypothetical protein
MGSIELPVSEHPVPGHPATVIHHFFRFLIQKHGAIAAHGERYILKPLHELEPSLKEDILFAEKTERAFESYQKGEFTRKPGQAFVDELASW